MADPSFEIRQNVCSQFESSRKLFRIVQRLTVIAGDLDEQHQNKLQELANELIQTGTEVSDNAETIGKYLFNIITGK